MDVVATSRPSLSPAPGCSWEHKIEEAQMSRSREAGEGGGGGGGGGVDSIESSDGSGVNQDEIISSMYEVFVKGNATDTGADNNNKPDDAAAAAVASFPMSTVAPAVTAVAGGSALPILNSSLAAAPLAAAPLLSPSSLPPLPSLPLQPSSQSLTSTPPSYQLIQEDAGLDLDPTIDIDRPHDDVAEDNYDIDASGSDGPLDRQVDNDEAPELELPQSSKKLSPYQKPRSQDGIISDSLAAATSQLIDKDDPRSRLHYVKYLKRDGKTLKIWECGICSKEFRHQYTLMRHLPTHTDERNFKCEACGKAFRQLSTLSQHKAIHSDARPYVCEFCKKTFNRVSTLISHRKTHSEHKPHKCHLCGKGFHQKGNLRNHVFTHTNERPYKCELCNKGFNQMSNLVCHKAKAHAHNEKLKYPCSVCGKEFPKRFALRSHEEYKHNIKYRQSANARNNICNKNTENAHDIQAGHLSEDEQQNSDLRDRDLNMTEFMENIIIDKIETKAMETALLQGQTPFALLKPAKGIPVLVKVTPSGHLNHLLTPATAEDLKVSENMDSSTAQLSDTDGSKSVQIKVPVVATVTEKIETDGKVSFVIEPPGPDQEQVNRFEKLMKSERSFWDHANFSYIYSLPIPPESLLTPVDSIPEMVPCEADDFAPEEEFVDHQSAADTVVTSGRTGEELLELADLGDIQFVRPTVDGRYEVVTNSEARDLMAQNSHDVEILGPDEINSVIGVHSDIDYMSAMQPPQQLQLRNQPSEIIVPSFSNDFIMLDSITDSKAQAFADIDALVDKEELKQLLDMPPIDDQYVSDILHARSMDVKAILNENDSKTNCNQFPNVLNTRNEYSTIMASSLYSRNPQQPQYSLSILQDQMSYLKNSHNFNDDFNILGGESSPVDYSVLPDLEPIFFEFN